MTKHFKQTFFLKYFTFSLIRFVLEHGSVVWESVQSRFNVSPIERVFRERKTGRVFEKTPSNYDVETLRNTKNVLRIRKLLNS